MRRLIAMQIAPWHPPCNVVFWDVMSAALHAICAPLRRHSPALSALLWRFALIVAWPVVSAVAQCVSLLYTHRLFLSAMIAAGACSVLLGGCLAVAGSSLSGSLVGLCGVGSACRGCYSVASPSRSIFSSIAAFIYALTL